jgi:uncharacterized membrane protein
MSKTAAFKLLVAVSFTWCLTIIIAPLAPSVGVYEFFRIVCHQDPNRSWILMGQSLPVCIRCASISFGFLAAILAEISPKTQLLRWAVGLTVAEFAMAQLIYDSELLRSITGLFLGGAAAPFVRVGFEELWGRYESV